MEIARLTAGNRKGAHASFHKLTLVEEERTPTTYSRYLKPPRSRLGRQARDLF